MNILLQTLSATARRRFRADVLDWIEATETADAAFLEVGVKVAADTLVRTLDTTESPVGGVSNFAAIDHMYLYAGPRTLAGTQVRLKGATAPTYNNFVAGDLTRKTGLKGNGSNKWITLNILTNGSWATTSNAFIGGYVTEGPDTVARRHVFGSGDSGGDTQLAVNNASADGTARRRLFSGVIADGVATGPGLYSVSRPGNTTQIRMCLGSAISTYTAGLVPPTANGLVVLARATDGSQPGTQRIAAFALGQQVDEAVFRTAIAAYLTALNTAL